MKTHMHQIFLIVSFFTFIMTSTVAVSWVVTHVLHTNTYRSNVGSSHVFFKKIKSKSNFQNSFRLLIPQSK